MDSAKLDQFTVWYSNSEEFHRLKQEIFTHDQYYFETDNPRPLIIDAGAHIGLATLYFKKIFPAARITAIEPNPSSAVLLEKNLWTNLIDEVTVVTAALAGDNRPREFFIDTSDDHWFSTAGFNQGAWNGQQTTNALTVPTQPLADFLTEPVDFLKMDIEGAELEVLTAARSRLRQIKHLMVEFHPTADQSLPHLVELLKDYHFEVTLWKDGQDITQAKARGLVMVEAVRI